MNQTAGVKRAFVLSAVLAGLLASCSNEPGHQVVQVQQPPTLTPIPKPTNTVNAQARQQMNSLLTRATRLQVQAYTAALEKFKQETGAYPTDAEGLAALQSKASNGKPFVEVEPDGWGNPLGYSATSSHGLTSPDVWSLGPDGQTGTDDDIGNWSGTDVSALLPAVK